MAPNGLVHHPSFERVMAENGNDDLVIFGYSQSSMISVREMKRLAVKYPAGTVASSTSRTAG